MATKKNDYAERRKQISKDKMVDDFSAYLFTPAERKEMEARTKAAKARGLAEKKKKGKK